MCAICASFGLAPCAAAGVQPSPPASIAAAINFQRILFLRRRRPRGLTYDALDANRPKTFPGFLRQPMSGGTGSGRSRRSGTAANDALPGLLRRKFASRGEVGAGAGVVALVELDHAAGEKRALVPGIDLQRRVE